MTIPRLAHGLAALLFAMSSSAFAQSFSALPGDDKKLLWEEALATFDGSTYKYRVTAFATEDEAKQCLQNTFTCMKQKNARRFGYTHRSNEMPPALRNVVVALAEDDVAPPLRSPDGAEWWVVSLTKRASAKFTEEVQPGPWLERFAFISLPPVDALKNDPELLARRALNRLSGAEALPPLMASGRVQPKQLDMRLSSGATALLKAVYLKDLALMTALLDAGASPDACGVSACPLTTALLLSQGDAVRLLLSRKANPNGSGFGLPPLMAVAETADRELTAALLKAGANILQTHVERLGMGMEMKRSVMFYASSQEKAYTDWLLEQVNAAVAQRKAHDWSAWIEQDGKRVPVKDGATIDLKRRPFKLVFRANPNDSFRVLATEDPMIFERSSEFSFRRSLLGGFHVGASSATSKYITLFNAKVEKDATALMTGSTNEWSHSDDPEQQNGTRRVQLKQGGVEYVHEIEEIITESTETLLTAYKGPGLVWVMGPLPDIGSGADYFRPARIRLSFTR